MKTCAHCHNDYEDEPSSWCPSCRNAEPGGLPLVSAIPRTVDDLLASLDLEPPAGWASM